MIRREHAECQALRLTVLPGMADLKNTSEIINALKLGSRNLEHASRIVTEMLRTFAQTGAVPTPTEIIKCAKRTDQEFDPREWRCSECGGTGWKNVFELHIWSGPDTKTVQVITHEHYERLRHRVSGIVGEQLVSTAVYHCGCRVGRQRTEAIAAELLEKANEQPQKKTSRGKLHRVK